MSPASTFFTKILSVLLLIFTAQTISAQVVNIEDRWLFGIGPRLKFLNTEYFSGYFGTHYMYELERQVEGNITNYHHRSSSYLSLTLKVPEWKSKLITTTYFQPEWGNAADFRVSSEIELQLTITDNLTWNSDFLIFYESEPRPVSEIGRYV